MTDVAMPKLSDSMERGTVIRWLVDEGQSVAEGDELVEIETDKAAVTHAAPGDGVVHIVVPEGTACDVGATIAQISTDRLAGSPDAVGTAEPTDAGPTGVGTSPSRVAANGSELAEAVNDVLSATEPVEVPDLRHGLVERAAGPAATPLAKRAAALHEIALASVVGTGPRGRITQGDVLRTAGVKYLRPEPASAQTSPAIPPAGIAARPPSSPAQANGAIDSSKGDLAVQPLTSVQQVIATRMTEANAVVPAFQLQLDVVLDEVLELREHGRELLGDRPLPSINDFVIKASALALRDHPLANGSFTEDGFRLHGRVNVGFAVAAERSLLVPTIFDADRKSVGTIAEEVRDLACRARDACLTPAELSGGTFTVSNLGMYGMTAITPVINAPQAAILGVGAARPQLGLVEGEIVKRRVATLTLNCDHRILYGADAARFLADVQRLLEAPLSLLL